MRGAAPLAAFVLASASAQECLIGPLLDTCEGINSDATKYFCEDGYKWEWSDSVASLDITRSNSVAITIPDTVLDVTTMVLMGGCADKEQLSFGFCMTYTSNVDIYTPSTDSWKESEPLPVERYSFGAINIGSYIFMFGGRNIDDDLICQADVFDVVTETWTTLDNYEWENCKSHLGIFTENGDIYLVGGYDENYASTDTTVQVTIKYSSKGVPTALTYTDVASMKTPRGQHVCWSGGEGYAICVGGFSEEYTGAENTIERYDVDTDKWTELTPMNFGRADFVLAYFNDHLAVYGGEDLDGDIGYNVPVNYAEWYYIENDCWTTSYDLFEIPYQRFRYAAGVDTSQSRIYMFGGQSDLVDEYYQIEDTVLWYQESSSASALLPSILATVITATISFLAYISSP